MAFKPKYLNCRHNFGRTRTGFKVWGRKYIFGGKDLSLTQIFLSTTKFGGYKKDLEETVPE